MENAHVIVADEAFPLKPNIMRPYAGRGYSVLPRFQQIFNYRLSRARRVVENAFGLITMRWRILANKMLIQPERADLVVKGNFSIQGSGEKASSIEGYIDTLKIQMA